MAAVIIQWKALTYLLGEIQLMTSFVSGEWDLDMAKLLVHMNKWLMYCYTVTMRDETIVKEA